MEGDDDNDSSWLPSSLDDDSHDDLLYDTDSIASSKDSLTRSPQQEIEESNWARLPSQETEYSDWQLDIKFHGDEVISYLVHRYKLGPQSTYFNSIFGHNDAFIESSTRRSFIAFPEDAPITIDVNDFEMFLNFLYRKQDLEPDIRIVADSSYVLFPDGSNHKWGIPDLLPMLYLADYFGVKSLRDGIIMDVLHHHLTISTHRITSDWFEWCVEAYRFGIFLPMKRLHWKIECMCYIMEVFEKFWMHISASKSALDLKLALLRGVIKLRKKDLDERNRDFEEDYCSFQGCHPDEDDSCERNFRDLYWHKIVSFILQSESDLVDVSVFCDFQYILITEQSYDIDFNYCNALLYLKHEKRLLLDDTQTDTLTPLQELCISRIDAADMSAFIQNMLDLQLKPAFLKQCVHKVDKSRQLKVHQNP